MAIEKKAIDKVSYEKTEKRSIGNSYSNQILPVKLKCHICGKDDHIETLDYRKKPVIEYFVCKTFVEMRPIETFQILKQKGLCWQCLNPGELCSKWKHKDGKCYNKYVCNHPDHERHSIKKHVFVCNHHEE